MSADQTTALIGKIHAEAHPRDAVHIAVAPVIAGEVLAPGQHVGIIGRDDDSETFVVGRHEKPIGIVDPFIEGVVLPRQHCFLFLYPGSITSLRHEWAHPAFQATAKPQPVPAASDEEWPHETTKPTSPLSAAIPDQDEWPYNCPACATDVQEESREWIKVFAAQIEQTYNRLMEAAGRWVECEDYTRDDREHYKDVDYDLWKVFWHHYEVVTGTKVKDKESSFFTCSC